MQWDNSLEVKDILDKDLREELKKDYEEILGLNDANMNIFISKGLLNDELIGDLINTMQHEPSHSATYMGSNQFYLKTPEGKKYNKEMGNYWEKGYYGDSYENVKKTYDLCFSEVYKLIIDNQIPDIELIAKCYNTYTIKIEHNKEQINNEDTNINTKSDVEKQIITPFNHIYTRNILKYENRFNVKLPFNLSIGRGCGDRHNNYVYMIYRIKESKLSQGHKEPIEITHEDMKNCQYNVFN